MTDSGNPGFLTFRSVVEAVMRPPVEAVRQEIDGRLEELTDGLADRDRMMGGAIDRVNGRLDELIEAQSDSATEFSAGQGDLAELLKGLAAETRAARAEASAGQGDLTELLKGLTAETRAARAEASAGAESSGRQAAGFDAKLDDLGFRLNSTLVGLASDVYRLAEASPATVERLDGAERRMTGLDGHVVGMRAALAQIQVTLEALRQETTALRVRADQKPGRFAPGSAGRLALGVFAAIAGGALGAVLAWAAILSGWIA
ncbi:hypothetical protein [Sphaerisporangium dianthi]|uniref:Uncharacterized protein n=1 Tax=Sphaerisporangium dianthi TaxID=1436120 RepID=A0ABV9CBM1_9ACTN